MACKQTSLSRGNELVDAHEIVGDEIEHESVVRKCGVDVLGDLSPDL